MYENPDETGNYTCKTFTLFQISPAYAWKLPPFLRFDRGGGGVGVGVGVGRAWNSNSY